ncbi:MAG: bifunctional aldolase/short-chain dehydrogenase [Nannocystaceae bacterium]|nr:bifunctional aldolase/short-chain dehydrogenase [Nannocystaceae bacterium]
MKSRWSDQDAAEAKLAWAGLPGSNDDVALRVYTSRLIGAESSLVLHGGGNTSVKTTLPDDTDSPTRVLCVKGSGWDLGAIEPAGLPAVRLESLLALRSRPQLSDEAMVNAARTRLLDAAAPNPSVETLLHAFLPHSFIDHSHADAILTLVDQPGAESRCRALFGDRLAIVPYVMPGFALAKLAAEVYEASPDCEGLLLLKHGLFTFGATARESYERHIQAVTVAELAIAKERRVARPTAASASADVSWAALAPVLRGGLRHHGSDCIMALRTSAMLRAFVDHPEVKGRTGRGPMTPDHVIRTKPWPMVLDVVGQSQTVWPDLVDKALAAYRARYVAYFELQRDAKQVQRKMLDPEPRVVLVPGLGMVGVGVDAGGAAKAADLYEHTATVIDDAERLGGYEPLPPADLFDMEYWSLEQAKLGKRERLPLSGQVVLVTGAASGIGYATATRFKAAGAHVVAIDRDPRVEDLIGDAAHCAQVVDVTDRAAVAAAVTWCVERFGGLDGVVSNAGVAQQAPIATCPPEVLEASLAVNLWAHQWVAQAATEVMRAQGRGGWLLFNASKAAFNPGADFGPYAIAKAALVALMKQYALEGAAHGIRSNAVNADRVRTGLLGAADIEARAAARGLSADAYFRSNLLGREVTAADVADAFLALATARATTAAVLPVDGGNIAAAPR